MGAGKDESYTLQKKEYLMDTLVKANLLVLNHIESKVDKIEVIRQRKWDLQGLEQYNKIRNPRYNNRYKYIRLSTKLE